MLQIEDSSDNIIDVESDENASFDISTLSVNERDSCTEDQDIHEQYEGSVRRERMMEERNSQKQHGCDQTAEPC